GQENALRLEQLVVRVAPNAVGARVLDLDLAELPDRRVTIPHDTRHESVGRRVHAAGAPETRVSGRDAVQRYRECKVGGGSRRVSKRAVEPVRYSYPLPLCAPGEVGYLREVGPGRAVGRAASAREARRTCRRAASVSAVAVRARGAVWV